MNYGSASKYYDLFGSKDDIAFFKELAIQQGRKALELGVGTGRVAFELAKSNIIVHGIDNSKHMLNIARRKLETESLDVKKRVKLTSADMRSFNLKDIFPFVYAASSTFEHCLTKEDQTKCLTSAYKALENGGVLAFDVSQPEKDKAASSWWIDRRDLNKDEEVVRTIFSKTNLQTRIVSINLFFDVYRKGILKERLHEYGEAKLSSKQNIETLLRSVGFKIQNTYGGFNKTPHSEQSHQIVFVCRKP